VCSSDLVWPHRRMILKRKGYQKQDAKATVLAKPQAAPKLG
jgi:hypothetical protein